MGDDAVHRKGAAHSQSVVFRPNGCAFAELKARGWHNPLRIMYGKALFLSWPDPFCLPPRSDTLSPLAVTMVHTSVKTATTIIGMAMLCLVALGGSACVHQPSEYPGAAEPFDAANPVDASHVTKPGVPLDVMWTVDAGQRLGPGAATAVLTVSARGNLEEAVLTLEPSSGLRLVGPAQIRLGALAAGDTRRIEVPLELGDRGRAELRAVVAAEGGAGDVAVSVRRADVLYVLLGPARSFAARGSFIVAQQDSLRHALTAGRMTPEDFEAAMQQLGRGTGEVTTTRSEKKRVAPSSPSPVRSSTKTAMAPFAPCALPPSRFGTTTSALMTS